MNKLIDMWMGMFIDIDGQMDGWIKEWADALMDEWKNGFIDKCSQF